MKRRFLTSNDSPPSPPRRWLSPTSPAMPFEFSKKSRCCTHCLSLSHGRGLTSLSQLQAIQVEMDIGLIEEAQGTRNLAILQDMLAEAGGFTILCMRHAQLCLYFSKSSSRSSCSTTNTAARSGTSTRFRAYSTSSSGPQEKKRCATYHCLLV